MQSKTATGRIKLIIIFVGFVFFTGLFFVSLKNRAPRNLTPLIVNDSVQEQTGFGAPVRLKIPVINVDAAVELVGLTPLGAMGAPKGGKNVGWFDFGPHPGDIGSAVIDGHFGRWKNGEGSVFDDLDKLEIGDLLSVEDDKGLVTLFIVRDIQSLKPDADTTDVFSSDDGKSHLNLITCEGTWDTVSKSYSKRLLVFTDKVE